MKIGDAALLIMALTRTRLSTQITKTLTLKVIDPNPPSKAQTRAAKMH
jgi:hypothetical protein